MTSQRLSMHALSVFVFLFVACVWSMPSNSHVDANSMAADVPEWTIESMTRNCTVSDAVCHWWFRVNTNDGTPPTNCSYDVPSRDGAPASESPETGASCGTFTVTSGWSGYFGPGNGFTTLSVINSTTPHLIAWPAYTDKQLAGGAVVQPDQSYPVQTLPY